jgi:N-acetylneuraminic acid mutarotase
MFGGTGIDSTGTMSELNDLWKYNPSTGLWTWMNGDNIGVYPPGSYAPNPPKAVYGTQGVAAAGNMPGARGDAITWTDASNNLWMFGGGGYDSNSTDGTLNDLWKYSTNNNQWTWVSGADTVNATGIYGTQGVAAANNVPGARGSANSWIDTLGNFWLFGGYGYDSTGTDGELNDLWEYSPSTGQWTWVSGTHAANVVGVYGTQGVATAGNTPGGRDSASSWTDSSGKFWLFGGNVVDTSPGKSLDQGDFNDLWSTDVRNLYPPGQPIK